MRVYGTERMKWGSYISLCDFLADDNTHRLRRIGDIFQVQLITFDVNDFWRTRTQVAWDWGTHVAHSFLCKCFVVLFLAHQFRFTFHYHLNRYIGP